jgi:thymidylate synthase (FAD)
MGSPIVRVIAHTEFHGVPRDLLHVEEGHQLDEDILQHRGQDCGTTGERLIECAGRTCYDSYGRGRTSQDYHKHIMEVGHGSVTEHAWITFFLGNISRGLTHELVRHRVGVAISQRSTRYVDESDGDWVRHPLIDDYIERCEDDSAAELEDVMNDVESEAKFCYDQIVAKLEPFLIKRGVDKFTARKQARGAARGYLGNALATEMVWSCNVRTLRETVLKQRANGGADAEIRRLAIMIYEAALPYYPTYLGSLKRRAASDGLTDELYV